MRTKNAELKTTGLNTCILAISWPYFGPDKDYMMQLHMIECNLCSQKTKPNCNNKTKHVDCNSDKPIFLSQWAWCSFIECNTTVPASSTLQDLKPYKTKNRHLNLYTVNWVWWTYNSALFYLGEYVWNIYFDFILRQIFEQIIKWILACLRIVHALLD